MPRDRITSVRTHVLEAPLAEPWDFGIEPYRVSTCVVVEIASESGAVGYGECIARKSASTTSHLVEDLLAPIALGRDVADAGMVWEEGFNTLRRWGHHRGFLLEALSGLDIALWDLRARVLDVPLRYLLPNGGGRTVQTYASSVYFKPTVEEAVDLAEEVVRGGDHRLKIKIGHRAEQGGLRRDIETVSAIHEALPSDVELMLDANGAYSFADARILVEALAPLGILWLEEPFPPDDVEGYAALARISPIPLAAGESEFSVFGFSALLARGALGYAQPDIARCGGFTGALQILDLCYAHNVPVCPHTGFSGGINNLAGLHLAAGTMGGALLEHMIIGNPLRDIFTAPLPEPKGGQMSPPDGVGLGYVIDPAKLEEHRSDPATETPS
jgi:L-alanine-DL-glutamate epimerase-like enolase superfamily enzyme